jgi:hypothetical protein
MDIYIQLYIHTDITLILLGAPSPNCICVHANRKSESKSISTQNKCTHAPPPQTMNYHAPLMLAHTPIPPTPTHLLGLHARDHTDGDGHVISTSGIAHYRHRILQVWDPAQTQRYRALCVCVCVCPLCVCVSVVCVCVCVCVSVVCVCVVCA